MAAFEDEGYFCVDNLPSEMIRSLVELFMHAGSKVAKAQTAGVPLLTEADLEAVLAGGRA